MFEMHCRICLESQDIITNLSSPIDDELEISVEDCLRIYLNLTLNKNESYPQNVCNSCFNQILDVRNFYIICADSQKVLEGVLEVEKTVEEVFIEIAEDVEEDKVQNPEIVAGSSTADNNIGQERRYPECDICDETFESEEDLDNHREACHSIDFIARNIEDDLVDESQEHGEESDLESNSKQQTRKETYKTQHTKNSETYTPSKRMKRVIKCPLCPTRFSALESIPKHLKKFHENEGPLNCPLCSEIFDARLQFCRHLRTHDTKKEIICNLCGKICKRRDMYDVHMRTHTGERPFTCDFCGRAFNQSSTLQTHLHLHTGKLVTCEICGKKFTRQSFLKLHYRAHNSEKPYSCEQCPKRFKYVCHLREHELNHANPKPFVCELCDKAFAQKSTLRVHLSRYHYGDQYQCPDCGKVFNRPVKFREHLASAHSNFTDVRLYKKTTLDPKRKSTEPTSISDKEDCDEIEQETMNFDTEHFICVDM